MSAGESSLSSYQQAKADFGEARYGLAVKRFQMAMAEEPASVEAVNGLAAAYDQLGRYDLSERFYQRALAMDPASVQTLNNFGYSLLRSEEHTSELQSLMRISYAVFCLKKKKHQKTTQNNTLRSIKT